jgi:hypothetical protein
MMQFSEIRLGDGQYLTQRWRRLYDGPFRTEWTVVLAIHDGECIELVQTWDNDLNDVPSCAKLCHEQDWP